MALTDSAGLLFKIRADATQAKDELGEVQTVLRRTETAAKGTSAGFASMVNPAALATAAGVALGAALVGAARAAVALTEGLFGLAKSAAEFGEKIFDASKKTGLGAETLSAFSAQAELSGTSFEQLTKGITKFGVEVGKAAQGNEEAQKKMALLKVTSTDLDTALGQVFKTINEGRTQTEKLALASAAFGERIGPSLIQIIEDTNGNVEEMTRKFKELGVTIDEEAIRQADEFQDTMALLSKQVTDLGQDIGRLLIPKITELAKELSDLIKNSQDDIQGFASRSSSAMQGVLGFWDDLIAKVKTYGLELDKIKGSDIGGPLAAPLDRRTPIDDALDAVINRGRTRQQNQASDIVGGSSTFKFPSKEDLELQTKAAEDAAKEREEIAKRNAAAQVEIFRNQLEATQKEFQKAYESLKKIFAETGDAKGFTAELNRIAAAAMKETNDILRFLEAAEARVAKQRKSTSAEMKVLDQEQQERLARLNETANKIQTDAEKTITEGAKRANKETLVALKERIQAEIAAREDANRTILARREADAKSEGDIIRAQVEVESKLLKFKLEKLQEYLAAVKGNADEEKRVKIEIGRVHEEQERLKIKAGKETGDLLIKNAKELLEITQQIADEEKRLLDFRREQTRKVLVNVLESAPNNKARVEAAKELEAFDFQEAIRKNKQRQDDLEAERTAALERVKGKENEEAQKFAIEELYKQKRLISAEEFAAELKALEEEFREATEEGGGMFGAWLSSWEEFFERVTGEAPDIASTLEGLAGIAQNAFAGMANAIGSVIEQWVIYGTTGPAVMRKVLAAALASIAAEAAVQAIYAAAWGFIKLAQGDYVAAGNAFVSAALFGAIAVGAALAGRAIAGDSFKKQTASSTGGASGQGSGTQPNVSGQGTQFSGQKDAVINRDINAPGGRGVQVNNTLTVKVEGESFLAKALRFELATNGEIRGMLKEVAQQS